MDHLPVLITDLALILGVAALISVLFKRIKLPLVLGYIVSGIIISPNFNLFPNIYEVGDVQVWGEIGVVFLLFSLGLEFSFKKLSKLGGSASVAAVFELVGMGFLGYLTAKWLEWPFMDRVFLGACLTVSSTTVIIKTFGDLSLEKRNFAGLVYGILVVEDIIAVTLLVLLGTFVITHEVQGTQVFFSVFKLIFFLILWFIAGILFVPSILRRARKFLTDEILLVTSIAMCLIMVYLSSRAGFSPALGAFIMGSLLSETTKAERIVHLVQPVRDLFGAIFFVSVGMLVSLPEIAKHIWPVLLISAVVILGKILFIGAGSFISGNSLKVSIQAAMSLTMIGEFSFIIASLGARYQATSASFYPIIIAVSAITIFIAPSLTLAGTPLYKRINSRMSPAWRQKLNRYSTEATTLTAVNEWQNVLKTFLINTVIYSVLLLAMIILSNRYLFPWLTGINSTLGGPATVVFSLALMAPLLWALVVRNERTQAFAHIYTQKKYLGPIWLMRVLKVFLALVFIMLLLRSVFSLSVALYTALVIIFIITLFRHRLQKMYDGIEGRFISNLNVRELEAQKEMAMQQMARRNNDLAPWDAHMTTFDVSPEAVYVTGKTLNELQWRERIGINVALIKRGQFTIISPGRDDKIYPNDKLFIICTDSQEKRMAAVLRPDKRIMREIKDVEIQLGSLFLGPDSPFLHKTIREADIRGRINGLVVGIERNGERLLNPESDIKLEEGDILWIVGEKKLIKAAL
jgi:CPA2 family monovalent cation:H+ antiporter-2